MKRILVTGGLGTIGIPLVKVLKADEHKVFVCDVGHHNTEAGFSISDLNPNAEYYRCDVGEYRQVERLFSKIWPIDTVYHLAAEFGRWNGEDFYENLWRTNAIGTKNIIRMQEKLGFDLVHFSSSEVYGDWNDVMTENVMSENSIRQLNDYAISKWVNEMQIANSAKQFKTKSVIVRLFNTYGPGEYYSPYRSVNCRFIYCALNGIPWTVHRGHIRTSTFVTDTVRTLANIADRFNPGSIYNIGGASEHTIEQLSEMVIKATGANPELVSFEDSEQMTTTAKLVDCSKAEKELDHRNTVSLEDGISMTAEWMKSVYK